ncbi:MAG: response regulator [Deltaproteobacteria bacterium]|nr:response regulator [Deltaproteobacteria bacterium]
MGSPKTEAGGGQEVLVLDADETVRKGVERLFREAGLSVTVLSDIERAQDQIANRFFPVVLADLDTPKQDSGIDLVKFVRERSPLTAVIVMSRRIGFDAVAPVFRAGATDVIPKAREYVRDLRERVVQASNDVKAAKAREQLLIDLIELNEELLRRMMGLSRQAIDAEDKLKAREGGLSSSITGLGALNLLLVDDDPTLANELEKELTEDKGWRVRHVQTGGEALDSASQVPPMVLVAKENLPDLTGTMVVKTIKATVPSLIAMVFAPPAPGHAGEVRIADQSRLHVLLPQFMAPAELVTQLAEVREALLRKAKDRRYVKIFQNRFADVLEKCNRLKQQVDALVSKGK